MARLFVFSSILGAGLITYCYDCGVSVLTPVRNAPPGNEFEFPGALYTLAEFSGSFISIKFLSDVSFSDSTGSGFG